MFTIPMLVTVEVADPARVVQTAQLAAAATHVTAEAPSLPRTVSAALAELAYPPAVIDGYPGLRVIGYTLGDIMSWRGTQ